jgi:hypothetical protein
LVAVTGKTLVFGTSYVQGAVAAEVFRMWRELTRVSNPGVNTIVVDSASPGMARWEGRPLWEGFDDNIGHLSKSGRDGWGRAFTHGLRYAITNGYEWAVHIECDLLFARPVAETIAKMEKYGVKIAAPLALPHQFVETALMFVNVPWAVENRLIERYDWENPPPDRLPEWRIQDIAGDALFTLPLRGMRNDQNVPAERLAGFFPDGVDWITHADLPALREFMRMNGKHV